MSMVEAKQLHYDYLQYADEGEEPVITHAIKGVDLKVEEGQFIAVIGHNGCGKSTLAKHINALLLPTEGTVWVRGMDTKDETHLWDIRQSAGMVFQNPDNQIIASVVEEDVGFGPENMGVPTDEIWKRVDEALAATGMTAYREHSPNRLSGGQKQRVAIAGVMAMRPRCIILDEPTAMLDPLGRKEVLDALRRLNKAHGVTVILITHYMEEITDADVIFVMEAGRVVLSGTPEEVFAQYDKLQEIGLDVPQVTALGHELKAAGLPVGEPVLHIPELVDAVLAVNARNLPQTVRERCLSVLSALPAQEKTAETEAAASEACLLKLENISYIYSTGTSYEIRALDNVSMEIARGECIGIIGHTGSGKSTVIQHFNGLMKPSAGRVLFHGEDIWAEGYNRRNLRFHVGLVFQYPEYQLFEVSVIKDVCFGPKNQGLSPEECLEKAERSLSQVGIGEELYEKSPLELSGGQKRRVAIAGVLAMDPDVLILDEPTAGLDPRGKKEILDMISQLHRIRGITVILVSHSMEDAARYVDRLIVMNKGRKAFDGPTREIFANYAELEAMGLSAPQVTYIVHALKEKGMDLETTAITVPEAQTAILRSLMDEKRGS